MSDTSAKAHDWTALRRLAEAAAASREQDLDGETLDLVAAFDAAFNVDTVLALLDRAERAEAERDDAKQHEAAAYERQLGLVAERDEAVAALALYRAENGCTRGQRTTQWCGEASKLRRAWLRVIQAENSCPASGGGCLAKRCGCVAEMEMLINEAEMSHD